MLIYCSADAEHTGVGLVSSGVWPFRSYEYCRNGGILHWGPDQIWSVPLQSPTVQEGSASSAAAASYWAPSHALFADHLRRRPGHEL